MSSSSRSMARHHENSPSLSPLSPTIIHYDQKYQSHKIPTHHHHHHQKKPRRRLSHTNVSFRHQDSNEKTTRVSNRRSSCVWERHRSSNERIYYYNTITDQSQWEKPPRDQLISSSLRPKSHLQSKRITADHDRARKPTNHHKRHGENIEFIEQEEKTTPTSPPPNELIRMDLVDPFPTSTISSLFHSNPLLSTSTINAILALDHSHSNQPIEHLHSRSLTQIECKVIHSSYEQHQFISLRAELYSLRRQFERNRCYLLHYHFK